MPEQNPESRQGMQSHLTECNHFTDEDYPFCNYSGMPCKRKKENRCKCEDYISVIHHQVICDVRQGTTFAQQMVSDAIGEPIRSRQSPETTDALDELMSRIHKNSPWYRKDGMEYHAIPTWQLERWVKDIRAASNPENAKISKCAGCMESEGDCPSCSEHPTNIISGNSLDHWMARLQAILDKTKFYDQLEDGIKDVLQEMKDSRGKQ